ncbi:hypothetical protein T439DRAFT_356613 [Meredithblackwellia eburnea MCA 4105]
MRPAFADLKLEGNTGGIPDRLLGWLESFPADTPIEILRERLLKDGVVHVKNVLPRDRVLETRRKYFEFVAPSGVLKEGSDPVDGIFCGGDPVDFSGPGVAEAFGKNMENCEYLKLSVEAGMAPFINEFAKDEDIKNMVARLKPDWKQIIVFQRQLLRSNIPGSVNASTKVHYDQIFLRAAPPTSLTAWVPIGDIEPLEGGLLYLEDSVSLGQEIEDSFTRMNSSLTAEERISAFNVNMVGKGFLASDPPEFAAKDGKGKRWLVGDYEAGDVVFHHPCMIHCSANNVSPSNRIRLATDLRYADTTEAFDERWAFSYFRPNDGL